MTFQDVAAIGYVPGLHPIVGKRKLEAAAWAEVVREGVADVQSDNKMDSDYSSNSSV